LDRIRDFLPKIEAANLDLEKSLVSNPHCNFDIEDVDGTEGSYIEMDLACGVVDLKDKVALEAAEKTVGEPPPVEREARGKKGGDEREQHSPTDACSRKRKRHPGIQEMS